MGEQTQSNTGTPEAEYPPDFDPSRDQADMEHSKGKGVYPGTAGQAKIEGQPVDTGTDPV